MDWHKTIYQFILISVYKNPSKKAVRIPIQSENLFETDSSTSFDTKPNSLAFDTF